MTTQEKNVPIAKFMGWVHVVKAYHGINLFEHFINGVTSEEIPIRSIGDFEYDSSWDELMPVVEKIAKQYSVSIDNDSGMWQVMIDIANVNVVYPILRDAVYEAVVQFTQWHNQQPK